MKLSHLLESEFENITPDTYVQHVDILNEKIASLSKNVTHYGLALTEHKQSIKDWATNNGYVNVQLSDLLQLNIPEVIEYNKHHKILLQKHAKYQQLLELARQQLKKLTDKTTGKFAYQYIVMTGFRDAELENCIESNGGIVQSNVNNKTNILIAKDINKNSGKIQKAKMLRVRIISLSDFKNIYAV